MSSTTLTDVPAKIGPGAVADRLEELFVLDVRNEEDYDEWAIEGSHNVPIYDELLAEDFSGLDSALDELPPDREIAVVCVAGITSSRAAQFLRDRGYRARTVRGGMGGWGEVHRRFDVDGAEGVVQFVRPGTGCVSYLLHDGGEALVVDPSRYVDEYQEAAEDIGVELVGAVDTHVHADHVSGGPVLADRRDVPYYRHPADGELDAATPIGGGETLPFGHREVEVVHTPGHTPGSVCLRLGDALLSGDTLFVRGVGRPDLEGEDEAAVRAAAADLYGSVDRLRELPDDTLVLPGHLSDESLRPLGTTLYGLAEHNDLVGTTEEDAFVERVAGDLGTTPANFEEIKAINRGEEPRDEGTADLELGPNNCAAG